MAGATLIVITRPHSLLNSTLSWPQLFFLTNILLFFIWIGRSTAKLREEFDSGVPFGWFALFFCDFAELSTVDGVKTSKWSRISEFFEFWYEKYGVWKVMARSFDWANKKRTLDLSIWPKIWKRATKKLRQVWRKLIRFCYFGVNPWGRGPSFFLFHQSLKELKKYEQKTAGR